MSEVVRQLSERLAARGHSVTVVTAFHPKRDEKLRNGVTVVTFNVRGNAVTGLHGDVEMYERFLLESRFDIVTNFAAQQWATDIAFPLLPRIAGIKVFVPTGFSALHLKKYRRYFEKMPSWMSCYDMLVFPSQSYRDIEFARNNGLSRLIWIPNGAAADEFGTPHGNIRSTLEIPTKDLLILHVGSHTGLKGHHEVMSIFAKSAISGATLLLVGDSPPGGCGESCAATAERFNASLSFRENGKRILVRELSRADTVAAYHAADLFLFPSNIECSPIVLFEAMASKTPFLVTDAGNAREIICWSKGGRLLPSAPPSSFPREGALLRFGIEKLKLLLGRSEDFCVVTADIPRSATLLEQLCREPEVRSRMAEAGYVAWQQRFTWEKITHDYEVLYRTLVSERSS